MPARPLLARGSPAEGEGGRAALARRNERRLLRAAREGSEEALERLFAAHWPAAYRAAYLITRDAAAAEDIAQEAFLAAVRRLDRFDSRRRFAPWLHRIAVNRAIDHTRARQLRGQTLAEPDRLEGRGGVEPELSDRLLDALGTLDPERRALVVMRHLLELTPGEIAEALEIPRGTVNSRLRRALDQLARLLREEDGDG